MRKRQNRAKSAQQVAARCVWTAASAAAFALASAPARADGYIGDMAIPEAAAPGSYVNSGATVWTGAHDYATVSNPAGASILNQGAAAGDVSANGGVIRNAPAATWTGDVVTKANVAGAKIVNEGTWNGALANAGGGIDNSGTVSSVNNAAGVFTNEGTVKGDVVNGAQAANSGRIGGKVVNASQFVNNAAGSVAGGLIDTGSTTNNGTIAGGVVESGAFSNNASGKVVGGFALNAGSAVNNGEIDGGVRVTSGSFTDNGVVQGGATVAGKSASLTVNHILSGKTTVSAGSLVVNSAGVIEGDVVNAGSLNNAGDVKGGVASSGALVNDGAIEGTLRETGGSATNNQTIGGDAGITGGQFIDNGAVAGALSVGKAGQAVVNGAVAGAADSVNVGALTVNAKGQIRGALINTGQATINGDVAGGLYSKGQLTLNASGHVENGLHVTGGTASNAGTVSGGAYVKAGALTTTGEIDGGLVDNGLVKASGVLSGAIQVNGAGKLVVGDGTANGARLTLKPGSSLTGVVTLPVDLTNGRADFLAAAGSNLTQAKLDLSGKLSGTGDYWGRISLTDTPIALTDAAKQALAAASGALYRYADPDGMSLVQTINPGLGVTASQIAVATSTAFALALQAPPADSERAPADPTPNLGSGAAWSRGFGAALSQTGESVAASGPAFDATRLSTRLAGGEVGVEYGVHNLQNSGLSLSVGLAGGEAVGRVADSAGSGASASVQTPFVAAYSTLTGLGFTGRLEARYVRVDMQIDNPALGLSGQGQRAQGMSYSGEWSYRIPLDAMFVEPSAGVSYSRLSIADEATNVGDLSFGQARLTLGHVGVKVGGDMLAGALRLRPYAMASVGREWLGGASVSVPGGPTYGPVGFGAFEQVGLGVTAALARTGVSGYAQAAWSFGQISGATASGGVRVDF
jgi:hypothetical protein